MDLELAGKTARIANADCPAGRAVAAALAREGAAIAAGGACDIAVMVLPPLPEGGALPADGEAVLTEAWEHVVTAAGLFQSSLAEMTEKGWGRLLFAGPIEAKAMTGRAAEIDRAVGLAILGLLKAASGEVGPAGVSCNSVLWDSARGDEAMAAMAAAVCYLASPGADFLTGVTIAVDGAAGGGVF